MFVNNENWEDCKKYFEKTFVKFPDLTNDKLWKITQVDPQFIYADSHGESAAIQLDLGYNLDYVIPKKTIFQHGEYATMLSRIPARMWKKGMTESNTKFDILSNEVGWKTGKFDINIIEGFINKPCYYSLKDALNEFKRSDHLQSAALSPRIALSKKGGIFVDQVLIGRYSADKKVVLVKKIFQPEVKKTFNLENVTIKSV